MGTAVAYLRHPEHKAFVLLLPVPFTLATLSVGKPVDATNVLGMSVLFGFTIAVWALHVRWRVPILPAIAAAAIGYCVIGGSLACLTSTGNVVFGVTAALTFVGSVGLVRGLPYREEPQHRTPLPLWLKLPVIALVIFGLVSIKKFLGGFMTMFPMVGVVAAYECRHSLWTNVRKVAWVNVLMTPVMVAMRLTQGRWGMPVALAVGWAVLLPGLWLFHTISQQAFAAEAD